MMATVMSLLTDAYRIAILVLVVFLYIYTVTINQRRQAYSRDDGPLL